MTLGGISRHDNLLM